MNKMYLVQNKENNKYYNFITKMWVNNASYACLTQNESEIDNLSIIWNIRKVVRYVQVENNSIVDQLLCI